MSLSLFKKSSIVALLFAFVLLAYGAALVAQQQAESEIPVPFLYPDPRTVGIHPYVMHEKPAGAVTNDRYAGVPEQERLQRMLADFYAEREGCPKSEQLPCPLCEEEYKTPCGKCKMCVAGFPCEKTLCRHCLLPRSKNMGNACDLTAGDEPCGTCDACREHRSDPCEHADDGYGPRGEFNPYREPRLLSVIPRPILDAYNNGARKHPVYYNPAPYYRPTWNPSTFTAYNRPYTFRWSCSLCYKEACDCNKPGMAGQIPFAYACKFCRRNPCACTMDICDTNKPMDPMRTAAALAELKAEAIGQQPAAIQGTLPSPSDTSPGGRGVVDLFHDVETPEPVQESEQPPTLPR